MTTYYEILGVRKSATPAQIVAGYKNRVATLSDNTRSPEEASAYSKALDEAYSVLCSPTRRREYDYKLTNHALIENPASKTTIPWKLIGILALLLIGGAIAYTSIRPGIKQNIVATQDSRPKVPPAHFEKLDNTMDLLTSGNFAEVEDYYSKRQKEFESGALTEYDIREAYGVFHQKQDVYRAQLDGWIKAYPQSPSAYLARGIYYRVLGNLRRGEGAISELSPEDLEFVEQMWALGKEDLETSLRLNPRGYWAMLQLLNIAQEVGDTDAAQKYLRLGNAELPSNLMLRARYMLSITSRWGGSSEIMQKFIDESRDEGVPASTIDLLTAIKLDDEGFVLEQQGRLTSAEETYEKALQLSMSSGAKFRDTYLGYASELCKKAEYTRKPYCQ